MSLAVLLTAAAIAVSPDPASETQATAPETAAQAALDSSPAASEAQAAPSPASPASPSAEATSSEPGGFARWWNGQESIYDAGVHLSLGAMSSRYNGGRFVARGADDKFESANVERVAGIRLDLNNMGRYFGLLTFGAAYYEAGEGTSLRVGDQDAAITLRGVDVRLVQPRMRFAMWRFEVGASLGPVFHLGWAKLDQSRIPSGLAGVIDRRIRDALDSSLFATLGLEAGAALRFYPLSFLFVEGAYSHSFSIWNIVGETEGMGGFRVGAGLAF